MAALTASLRTLENRPRAGRSSYVVASGSTVYAWGFVGVNDAGFLVPWSDTANLEFVGIALQQVTGDGTLECRVNEHGDILTGAAVASAAQGSVGELVYCETDNPADMDLSASTNVGPIGRVVRYGGSSGVADVELFTPAEHLLS
jgi:hypothetical protein